MFMNIILIFIGGGLGAVSRFTLSESIYSILGRSFPFGILTCNILGSLLIGFLSALFMHKLHGLELTNNLKILSITGFLGGFTTFSSFSLDVLQLLQNGAILRAISYILVSIIISIIFVYLGYEIGKII